MARGLRQEIQTVVGLATEVYEEGRGYSFDACYLHIPTWAPNNQKEFERIQSLASFFSTSEPQRVPYQEHPDSDNKPLA